MHRFSRFALCLIPLLGACAGQNASEEDTIVLESPDDDGKSDSVQGKELHWIPQGDNDVSGGRLQIKASITVVAQSKTDMSFKSARYVFGPTEVLDLGAESFESNGWWTKMAFRLFARGDDGRWVSVECPGQSYFGRVKLDETNKMIYTYAPGTFLQPWGTPRSYAWGRCYVPSGERIEFGVVPFPASGFGNLAGSYEATLNSL
jgi:hypothetical protein